VQAHPEVPDIVLYNLAASLSKTINWDDYKQAIAHLWALLSRLESCTGRQTRRLSEAELDRKQRYQEILNKLKDLFKINPAANQDASLINCSTQKMRLELLALSAVASALVFELEPPLAQPQQSSDEEKKLVKEEKELKKLKNALTKQEKQLAADSTK